VAAHQEMVFAEAFSAVAKWTPEDIQDLVNY